MVVGKAAVRVWAAVIRAVARGQEELLRVGVLRWVQVLLRELNPQEPNLQKLTKRKRKRKLLRNQISDTQVLLRKSGPQPDFLFYKQTQIIKKLFPVVEFCFKFASN